MKFDKADQVEQTCWEFRQADYPRAQNRARIQDLFNGVPPFQEDQPVNVNFLEGTRLAHDARSQFYGAFLKPGSYFTAHTDAGSKSKNGEYSSIVTYEMNRLMKRSMNYFETFRSKFAMDVLHGIGPAVWEDGDKWCPDAMGIEDVLVPARTLLTMKNLPFFCVYRTFTAPELIKLTSKKNLDPAWNMPLVKKCIKWVDDESTALMGNNWQEILTHPIAGMAIFAGVMLSLFVLIFWAAKSPMDLIDHLFTNVGTWVTAHVSGGDLQSLLVNGVIGGVGGQIKTGQERGGELIAMNGLFARAERS